MLTTADHGPELVRRHDLPSAVTASRPGRLASGRGSDKHDERRVRHRDGRLREIWIHAPQRGRTADRPPNACPSLAATTVVGYRAQRQA